MFNLKESLKTLGGGKIMVRSNRTQDLTAGCQDRIMIRNKIGLGLICLLAIGVFASSSWAMDKKPAGSEELRAKSEEKAQVEAQPEAKGTETAEAQAIEPKLVMEYKLTEGEEIVDVIFDETVMTVEEARALGMKGLEQRKATETVKVQYPKVVITKETVKFLDEEGKVERQISLEKQEQAIVSLTTGKVIIVGGEGESIETWNKYWKWVDENGKLFKKEDYILGEFGDILMSENGKYVAIGLGTGYMAPEVGECSLYDINGNKLWTYKIEYPYWGGMDIFDDGTVLIVRAVEEEGKEKVVKVALIDVNGKKLWKQVITGVTGSGYKFFTTREGKIILYGENYKNNQRKSEDEIYHLYGFDKKGNLLWQPKKYIGFKNSFHRMSISKKANYLIGHKLWEYVWVMDINTGEFIWKYPLKGWKPETLEISPDGRYILLGKLILLDGGNGKVLKQIEGGGDFLGTDKIWRRKGNKIEIFNISDILKEED